MKSSIKSSLKSVKSSVQPTINPVQHSGKVAALQAVSRPAKLDPSKPERSVPKSCEVTLLLAAGHQCHLVLKPDDPLLHQLFQVMLAKTQPSQDQVPRLLQIPVKNGRAAFCVSSTDIIAITTEPALFIQTQAVPTQTTQTQAAPQTAPQTASASSFQSTSSFQPASPSQSKVLASGETLFLPVQSVQFDGFLTEAHHAAALEIALSKQAEFVGSTTTTQADNYRQSAILYATLYPEFYHLLRQNILDALPNVLQQLQMPQFQVGEIEMQMTAHNDGCFYKVHNDSGDTLTRTRQLTYVYYFYQAPQGFSGGELKLYDTELWQGGQKQLERTQLIQPRNNSIVFFDSRLMHEVLPVSCPSRTFAHSRFTLNGWLRRANG